MIDKLLELKKRIEEAKFDQASLKGQKKQLMSDLKKLGCSTIKEAKVKLDKMEHELVHLEEQKNEKIKELKRDYDF